MSRPLVRAALLLAGAFLGLLAAEGIVRAFVPVRDVGPPLTVYDPVMGKKIRPGLRCTRRTPDFRMRFSSNSLGWRGPEPVSRDVDVLFLGDSFTMGYGVDDGREFPQLLARSLGKSVVNMGLGGTGQGRWPLVLRGDARGFDPETVVLQLCSNDVEDDVAEGLVALDDRGELVRRAPSPPSAGRRLQLALDLVPWLGESHLLGWLRQVRIREVRADAAQASRENPEGLALAEALLEESLRCCAEQGWKVVVLSADMTEPESAPFAAICARREVPFVRMPSKREAPELYFALDGHWTEAGHRLAAERLEPWLR